MKIEEIDGNKTLMQNVKQRFFALRNGIIADQLRKNGLRYKIIFGLNIPQLKEIAEALGKNHSLATELWANETTRESRLLAPMLIDVEDFGIDSAWKWIESISESPEEIDVLCHFLLRKTKFVDELIGKLIDSNSSVERYLALRLSFSRISLNPEAVLEIAEGEIAKNDVFTRRVAIQLREEVEFLLGI